MHCVANPSALHSSCALPAEQINSMLHVFGGMFAKQQEQNQHMFQLLMQMVGSGAKVGEKPQEGMSAKEYIRTYDSRLLRKRLGHCSLYLKCKGARRRAQ